MTSTILSIAIAVFASTGFWAFVQSVWQNRSKEKSAETKLLMGIAFDRLAEKCEFYLKRGYITLDEYHDLKKYLYDPYCDLGGNGTGKKMWELVEKLPIKEVANYEHG